MRRSIKLLLVFTVIFSLFSERSVYGLESSSIKYQYDDNGRLTYTLSSKGTYNLYHYDTNGNLISTSKKSVKYLGYLETPTGNDITSPYIKISGWYVDTTGVESIKIYVNNEYKGSATYGDNREDVYNTYPEYSNHNSGYHFDTVLPNVKQSFNIKVVIRNKIGIETNYEKTVKLIETLSPLGYLDLPLEGEKYNYYGWQSSTGPDNQLKIYGWYLDVTPIENISVYVDNVQKYTGSGNRVTRNDVYNAYPQYNDRNSGIQVTVPKPPINSSRDYGKTISHTIKVIIVNKQGQKMEWTRNIKIYYENPADPGTWT